MSFHPSQRWPRIRDLPEHEQAPFLKWLECQTRPMLIDDPDPLGGYFGWDYDRWKRHCHADAGALLDWMHRKHDEDGKTT
jgi:hypothetical protein